MTNPDSIREVGASVNGSAELSGAVSRNSTRVAERTVKDAGAAAENGGSKHLGLALLVIATAQLMVVLDATIVNVALPHIQNALHFSGTGLEWVVNAYALAFGGLLLLGGRSGDLLGRRRVFIAGIVLFSLGSLAGGFATDSAWLLIARVIQGIGGAFAAPTALSLIAVTFPEGQARNRAMAVYSTMSVAGAAVGLVVGGLLTTYASWRWVLFVNVPIGVLVALAAPRVLAEGERIRGHFDLPGAVTATAGLTALVYGLSNAATTIDGHSHWGDTKVVASLVGAVVLLAAFVLIESRATHPLLPARVLRSRDRTGAYLLMLCIGTAMFGMFYFLTIFVQEVWGYSSIKSGVAYLPMVAAMMVASGVAAQLVTRVGARPLLLAGSLASAGGMFWLSRLSEHSSYTAGLLGPMLVTAVGLGLLFVPISLVSLAKVPDEDAGVASSLLNTGQQIGGSIGLAVLGTVAWSAVATSIRSSAQSASAAAAKGAHLTPDQMAAAKHEAMSHALATGFGRGFLVSSLIALLGLVVAIVTIRISRSDLEGVNPMQAPSALSRRNQKRPREHRSRGRFALLSPWCRRPG